MPSKPQKPLQIRRAQKTTFRAHFLNEWLQEREMSPMDLVNGLNDVASMDTPVIDKSQVYRWLKGQLPQRATQFRIAEALQLRDEHGDPDPELLLTDPALAWIARKVKNRPQEEVERMKEIIELAFPSRTGTRN
jgi:hypothetical protein